MLVFNQQNERAAPIHSLDSVIASKKKKNFENGAHISVYFGILCCLPFRV